MTPSPPHPAYRPPRNYASGAASLSPHRLQRRTPHRRSGQNRPRDHRSSDKIAAAVVPLPPTTPVNASPAQAAASSNPHSHQPPTRRPAGSFLGGFRTPALRERANSTTGPASETLHHKQPLSLGGGNRSSCPTSVIAKELIRRFDPKRAVIRRSGGGLPAR